jgi:hypothetical protein
MISPKDSKLMRKAKSPGTVCLIILLGTAWSSGCGSQPPADVYQPSDVSAANSGDAAAQDRLLQAANQGNPEAEHALASMFMRSTAQKYADAANGYRNDVELGYPGARRKWRHECAQAEEWSRQAGDQGSADAQLQLAMRNLHAACHPTSATKVASTALRRKSSPVEAAPSDDVAAGAAKTSEAEQIASTVKRKAQDSKPDAAASPIHAVEAAPSDSASAGAAKASGAEQIASTAKHETQNSKPEVAAPQIHDRRVALVVGNSNYTHVPQLGNPRNDAQLMAETLSKEGFELIDGKALLDLDKASLEDALQKFGDRIQKLQRSGPTVALFYYAGHGIEISGENYLVPVSADPNKASDAPLQMVEADAVLSEMEDGGARLKIVILDACRNNPFPSISRGIGGGLAEMLPARGTLIAYATAPGRTAQDGAGRDSLYTETLAEDFKKPGLDLLNVFNEVNGNVGEATHDEQQPWTNFSAIDGAFCFAGCND